MMRREFTNMMMILAVTVLCLISVEAAGNKKSKSSSVDKPEQVLHDKVEQLMSLSQKRNVIKLSSKSFRELVKIPPKNYSVVVMFTALQAQRGCLICRQASEEFTLIANSYRYSPFYSNKMFFAMIDFDEGTEAFQSMNLNSAPAFIHFPAKSKPRGQDTMDIQRVGFSAEAISKWIFERTEVNIRVFRPPSYTGTVTLLMLISVVGSLVYLRRNNLEFIFNKTTWCMLSIFFVLFMLSGQMWNHIRGPPFVHKTSAGSVAYIHGSSQAQFVMETYFIMGLYGLVVLGVILLCEAGDQKADPGLRRIEAVVGLALAMFFYSVILSIFRSKAGGYPYSFLIG